MFEPTVIDALPVLRAVESIVRFLFVAVVAFSTCFLLTVALCRLTDDGDER